MSDMVYKEEDNMAQLRVENKYTPRLGSVQCFPSICEVAYSDTGKRGRECI